MPAVPLPIPLHVVATGQGRAHVVLLHGLFGSTSNMRPLARGLESRYRVSCLDLRNHGKSGRAASMRYEEMAADVLCYVQEQGRGEPLVLIGHSMGGKAAMSCALLPSAVPIAAVVVLDIAPVRYPQDLTRLVLQAMQAATGHLDEGRRRVDALLLERGVNKPVLRSFLMKNMMRTPQGGYRWRVNLQAVEDNIDAIHAFPEPLTAARCRAPSLFLAGEHSSYLHRGHHPALSGCFPGAQRVTIADTGHWLHVEKSAQVLAQIHRFLDGLALA